MDGKQKSILIRFNMDDKVDKELYCHPANYLEPFSSVYFDALFGSNSVTVRLKGSASAK